MVREHAHDLLQFCKACRASKNCIRRGRVLWHPMIQALCLEAAGADEALLQDLSHYNLAQATVTYLMPRALSALCMPNR